MLARMWSKRNYIVGGNINWCNHYGKQYAAAAKSLQSCLTLCDPIDGSPLAPQSLGFSRQEHWSGLPFPSPMENSMGIPKKLKTELPYDSAIPPLGIYLKKMKTLNQKGICTPMFTAALFTTAKIWKKMCKIHTFAHTHTHTRWNIIQPLKRTKFLHLH